MALFDGVHARVSLPYWRALQPTTREGQSSEMRWVARVCVAALASIALQGVVRPRLLLKSGVRGLDERLLPCHGADGVHEPLLGTQACHVAEDVIPCLHLELCGVKGT